jgi:hypothetical protein
MRPGHIRGKTAESISPDDLDISVDHSGLAWCKSSHHTGAMITPWRRVAIAMFARCLLGSNGTL